MKIPDYRLIDAELEAVCLRLKSVAYNLSWQTEADARGSILLAMDTVQLAKDWLNETSLNSTKNGGNYRNARQCFSMSLSSK